MACRAGCKTQDHESWGACARAARLNTGWVKSETNGLTLNKEKNWFKELDAYAAARRQGIQPKTTRAGDVAAAVEISETTGKAFDAAHPIKGTHHEVGGEVFHF